MTEFPGLIWLDDLRTYAGGGHVNSRWYVTGVLPEDVKHWYRRRLLADHTERSDGEWTNQRTERGARLSHTIRVRAVDDPGAGPRPQRPIPSDALTVVTDETALFPERPDDA